MASAMCIAVVAGTSGVAGASRFDKNDFNGTSHAGNSPDCQPGKGLGDTQQHGHVGPPPQAGMSPAQIHALGDNGCAVGPGPGPGPFVPGHGQVSQAGQAGQTVTVSPALTPQQLAAVTAQQQIASQQAAAATVQQATAAKPVTTTAHFTG
jgi:hypothetical protein